MGAYGSWNYLQEHQNSQIAAFVPIAGSGVAAWGAVGCDLAKVGIWAFHGDADSTVSVSGTNVPLDQLAQCPAPPAREVKKTIYPGVGHNSWDRTYDGSAGHDVFEWLLQFTRE
jgi:predicted peptidase